MNKRQIENNDFHNNFNHFNNNNDHETSPTKRTRMEIEEKIESNNKINLNPLFQSIFKSNNNSSSSSSSSQHQNIPLPLCGTCESIIDYEQSIIQINCQFCSHVGCHFCTPQCFVCGERFCRNCSLQNYDLKYERVICIDCNCSSLYPS